MKRLLKCYCLLACVLSLSVLSGCLAVAAGGAAAGTVAYVRGDSELMVDATMAEAVAATRAVISELGLLVVSETEEPLSSEFVTRNSQDDKITIFLQYQTENATLVRVRVGTFGDEAVSSAIIDKISKRL